MRESLCLSANDLSSQNNELSVTGRVYAASGLFLSKDAVFKSPSQARWLMPLISAPRRQREEAYWGHPSLISELEPKEERIYLSL